MEKGYGMSPKKTHEVIRMSAYINSLLRETGTQALRVVDVGAGQGYLTRAIAGMLNGQDTKVLALDWDGAQTSGAERWVRKERSRKEEGIEEKIAHKTIHITPDTLLSTIDEWVQSDTTLSPNQLYPHGEIECRSGATPVPVLFVGLHACGSLTPDILRAFFSVSAARLEAEGPVRQPQRHWTPCGAVIVGCCYNLLDPGGA